MIHEGRIRKLSEKSVTRGKYVLYWMQSSVRLRGNMALCYAIERANRLDLPVIAFFCINPEYPEANLRHYTFLAQGIIAAGNSLSQRGVPLVLRRGEPVREVSDAASDAALVVTDTGYLSFHREWREKIAGNIPSPLIQVEDNVVVPVAIASRKEEWSAGTFRPKIWKYMQEYLAVPPDPLPHRQNPSPDIEGAPPSGALDLIRGAGDQSVLPSPLFSGGEGEAEKMFGLFLDQGLVHYPAARNDPSANTLSHLSPFIHFGQISPVEVARKVFLSGKTGAQVFLEQLVVRRELAVNFVTYNTHYDSILCLPRWAKETLEGHAGDVREYTYSPRELERGKTHDPYWNAAQMEMVITGKMHGTMRMYWGKKILEWSESPEQAFQTAIALNNRYELDGRDPNAYAGIAWCFGKHDRPWGERPVFGKVRYMNAAGLERKYPIGKYVGRVEALAERYGSPWQR
ncbi:MAG: deoxyribodipyrimidine photo-lyase [Methanolinea sp.]|nr:deoxyribodipyrimidine photo-lyase [Methanolinea sp.]